MSAMNAVRFRDYIRSRKLEYLYPSVGPVAVFTVSYFTTNIGLQAIPLGIMVVGFFVAVKTLELYHEWTYLHRVRDNHVSYLKESAKNKKGEK